MSTPLVGDAIGMGSLSKPTDGDSPVVHERTTGGSGV
jgi:hypothetical protein